MTDNKSKSKKQSRNLNKAIIKALLEEKFPNLGKHLITSPEMVAYTIERILKRQAGYQHIQFYPFY